MKIQLPIRNFAQQQEIFTSPARFVIVPKGRRFGATKGAANNFIKLALQGKFKKGLWVDVISANIEKYIERYFMPSLKMLPPRMWDWKKQQKIVYIHNSYIDFRSSDRPENIEGFGYDFMFLNEAGIILKNDYLWNNAIKPMMWDFKCKTIVAGTPKGGGGVFEELFQRGLDKNQADYQSFRFSSFDNPHIQHQLILDDMKTMPKKVIDQEIYANFLEDSGIVFRGMNEVAVLDSKGAEPILGHLYVIGADIAKLEDFTVLTVYDRSTNHQVCQMKFNMLEYPFIRSKIKELSMKYNRALVILDSTGVGEPTYDDLVREGVPVEPFHFTSTLKKQLIEKLATWIELKHLKMLRLDETIEEFKVFTYDFSEKTDRVYYGAPIGFHDDIVISHALAIWSLQPVIKRREEPEPGTIKQDLAEKRRNYGQQSEYEVN